jgi:hypothetical protein
MNRISLMVALWFGLMAGGTLAAAQGVQTGTITGTVTSADGLSLPGVTVTISSPALQGTRSGVTDANGAYVVKGLPPGTYTVDFALADFQPAKRENALITVGGTAEVDMTMALAGVTEAVTVTGQSPIPLDTVTSSQAFTKREVDLLPVGRNPNQIADLAPGLSSNTPNVGQLTIAGATAFDNVFMVNGVDINDNLFGTANNLFIEDAIQETNVLTGGISAEYGRFSGGVVNLVTKSGGNVFSGTFRENFNNLAWIDETPRQKTQGIKNVDDVTMSTEGTFGGPIMRDRLWFFLAGRYEKPQQTITFLQSPVSTTRVDTNKRGEVKLTGTIAPGQVISGDYTNNSTQQNNRYSLNANSLDPTTLSNVTIPNSLFVTSYNGVLAQGFLTTLQYSQKKFKFDGLGGTSTAITDSPLRTRGLTPGSGIGLNWLYGAPFFSALDPEERNNRQVTGSLSYTLSSKGSGTHDLRGGVEWYRSTRTGGNSQTSTGYVFLTDYRSAGGAPVYDSAGVPIPVWASNHTQVQNWLPTIGAIINIDTTSLFIQDRWLATPALSVDLGLRYESVNSEATGDILTVDTTKWMPRLGLSYAFGGSGRTVVQATYGHYSGKYSEAQFAANTDVGTPSRVTYNYTGPAGQGRDFAPAYNLANYTTVASASFPTANIFFADATTSPNVHEATFSVGRELGQKGYVKVTYQFRRWYDFLEDSIQLSNGTVNVNRNGANLTLTKAIYDNTNDINREYQALVFYNTYRFSSNLTLGANYTLQLKNHGNSNVEAANQPGIPSLLGDYPEILGPALDRYVPYGRLADYQQHKLRVYGTFTQGLGAFGDIDVSPIWRVDSGTTYSLIASNYPITPTELARNPGYPDNDINASRTFNLFFGERGVSDFEGYGAMDLAVTYSIPIWRSARPWIKIEAFNVFNNQKLFRWDTTVTANNSSPRDASGLPTAYVNSPNFGTATADTHFPQPIPGTNGGRLMRGAIGFRF